MTSNEEKKAKYQICDEENVFHIMKHKKANLNAGLNLYSTLFTTITPLLFKTCHLIASTSSAAFKSGINHD